jgi:hypothetical protein
MGRRIALGRMPRRLRLAVALVLALAVGLLGRAWYLRAETEWFEASMRARVAGDRHLAGPETTRRTLRLVRPREECYPTLPRWIVARVRAPLQRVEAAAFESYLECLRAQMEVPDRGWRLPPGGHDLTPLPWNGSTGYGSRRTTGCN